MKGSLKRLVIETRLKLSFKEIFIRFKQKQTFENLQSQACGQKTGVVH